MTLRIVPAFSVNGDIRGVFEDGVRVGLIAKRGDGWAAVARGGRDIGMFESETQAARAVLAHSNAWRAAH